MDANCFFCEASLEAFEPGTLPQRGRLAFDTWLGRLWRVCHRCQRWNPVPLESRWETLEACERSTSRDGRILLEGTHLSLLAVGEAQFVRVGQGPRLEFSEWRYSARLDAHPVRKAGLLSRLIGSLPPSPAGGTDFHGVPVPPDPRWVSTPFQEHAGLLTALFLHVPLVEACPSCAKPFGLRPLDFAQARLVTESSGPALAAACGFCSETSALPLAQVRPTLRLALAVVNRLRRGEDLVRLAATLLEEAGGRDGFLHSLGSEGLRLDAAAEEEQVALMISLDEDAEAEALEREWRAAEEIAGIMDGELTEVPGFDDFRRRVLGS